ncbi:MAG: hypothetical protein JW776_13550 [Candidatus Lokiarchaeota archaeon]|nr:hypothetical protein [Candidatus Lokiarchaeota archaeon]
MKKVNITDFTDHHSKESRGEFDVLKSFHGRYYSRMRIGGEHKWKYNNGTWLINTYSILSHEPTAPKRENHHKTPSNIKNGINPKFLRGFRNSYAITYESVLLN